MARSALMKLLHATMFCSVVLASSLLGCSKEEGAKGEPVAKTAPAPEATPAKPTTPAFSGTLTIPVLSAANRAIDVYTPDGKPAKFADALAAAKHALGEPTHVDGATHSWAVVEGDKCAYYRLSDKGGAADSPGVTTVPADNAECLAATGKAPAPAAPADPAPAAPAADPQPATK